MTLVRRSRLAFALATAAAAAALTATPSTAIVGGGLAGAGEYPWMAAIYVGSPGGQYCGGTLVSPTVVVSAAHCILGLPAPGATGVLLGRTKLTGASGGEQIPIAGFVIHPQWNALSNTFDVAVVQLSRASAQQPISNWARPGQQAHWAPGTSATVTGWGATREGGSGSNDLKEAVVPVVDDTTCDSNYGGAVSPVHHVCAGYAAGGTDTCQGDSGGPLMVTGPNGQFILAGITSWGEGCARRNRPGVYSEVATYSSFIDLFA